MRRLAVLLTSAPLVIAGCSQPPAPPAPRSGTEVNGSFGKTWDAVIDFFSSKNIQIKTVDRASGLIVAEPATVASNDAPGLADCGTIMGAPIRATAATWNVLVRGDSTRATSASPMAANLRADCFSSRLQSKTAHRARCGRRISRLA